MNDAGACCAGRVHLNAPGFLRSAAPPAPPCASGFWHARHRLPRHNHTCTPTCTHKPAHTARMLSLALSPCVAQFVTQCRHEIERAFQCSSPCSLRLSLLTLFPSPLPSPVLVAAPLFPLVCWLWLTGGLAPRRRVEQEDHVGLAKCLRNVCEMSATSNDCTDAMPPRLTFAYGPMAAACYRRRVRRGASVCVLPYASPLRVRHADCVSLFVCACCSSVSLRVGWICCAAPSSTRL